MWCVRERDTAPPGGWKWIDPKTGASFQANYVGRIFHMAKAHRRANNLPIVALLEEIEQDLCTERPELCVQCNDDGKQVSLAQATKNVAAASVRWAKSGFATVDDDVYQNRLAICEACPHLRGWSDIGVNVCDKCGCAVGRLNLKLKMATEKCPLNPPKW